MAGLTDWLNDVFGGDTSMVGGALPGATSTPPMPPVQQTGSDGPAIAPPQPNPGAMAPPVDPSTQPLGGQGGGPPDPTPAAGPPDPPINPATSDISGGMQGAGPGAPPVPMPAPRPPGAGALPPAAPPIPPASAPAPAGAPLSLAPTAPGPSARPYQLGDQTALGRALGIDPHSKTFNDTLGGLGAGLTAAGNSKGKSPGQALASGAGATLEGTNKEAHASNKDAQGYLTAAINAKKAGDDAAYKTNYTSYLAAKLQLEQKQAADKDASTVANKNDSPTQLYLAAQRNVAADPLVKGSLTAYQAAIKEGDPAKIATAKSAYEQTVQERQAAHLAGVGLHPQDAATLAKQPGMTQANPLDAGKAGITPQNIGKKLQPGQYYTNPADGKVYQYKGTPSKSEKSSSATPAVSKPEPANPMNPNRVPASASADEDD